MRQLFDLKRIFAAKSLILVCVMAPVIVLLLFSAIFLPFFTTAGSLHFNVGICNQDDSAIVDTFIDQFVNSQAEQDVLAAYPVNSVAIGEDLLLEKKISVLLAIPEGFYRSIEQDAPQEIRAIALPEHALELSIVDMSLTTALAVVSQSQNVYAASAAILTQHGVSATAADVYLQEALDSAIRQYMGRRSIIGVAGVSTTLGDYLPLEYYTGAIFALFAALAMLPLIRITAADVSGPVLRRGLLSGNNYCRYYLNRLISGSALIFLVLLMLIPALIALRLFGSLIGAFSGSIFALLATMLLTALCLSALALALGAWIGREQPALWLGFSLVFLMAVCCGALLPVGTLPDFVAAIGRMLPLRPIMRLLSASLFRLNSAVFAADLLRLAGFSLLFLGAGWLGIRKRGQIS
jgi:hypothetical protein